MGWLFGSSNDKAAVSKAQRAKAIRVQERFEREERQARREAKLAREAARARRGWR